MSTGGTRFDVGTLSDPAGVRRTAPSLAGIVLALSVLAAAALATPASAQMTLSASVSPHDVSYTGAITYSASASGGDPYTTQYAFFHRRPGGTWIPSIYSPAWQSSGTYTWYLTQSDVGTWETYVWAKDANTPPSAGGGYGYAAGVNTMPIQVYGPPSVPGPTDVSCAYSVSDVCWVTGDFVVSAGASSGGLGSISYQICRSNDTSGWGGCDAFLQSSGGNSMWVTGSQLPSDGYRRAYYFQARDSGGAYSGWNSPRYVKVDRYSPAVSATDASDYWFSNRTPTLFANDNGGGASANSGLQDVRYQWNSPLNGTCTNGTGTYSGVVLTAPPGDNVLYACARDNTGRVSQWNGRYRISPIGLTGSIAPSRDSYLRCFTYTANASGGTPSTYRYAFFRRRPGGTWIPDVYAPTWQTSNTFTWCPGLADVGTWETYIWVKDADTPASASGGYGYAAGWNTMPIEVVGKPTVPGGTTVACSYASGDDCWVAGDFVASAAASSGGMGTLVYQICRSNDTTGWGGCDANLTLSGGTSITVSAPNLAADGYRRAYYFQASDSAGALSGFNAPIYVRIDRYAPVVSATNASTQWFPGRSAVVSASDTTSSAGANSGVAAVRYSWNAALDAGCTGGTATSSGATLTAPTGDNVLYLCARDNVGRVTQWSGQYRVSAPLTITSCSCSPASSSYMASYTCSATTSGGVPASTVFSFFRRRPGGTWVPDVNAPAWQGASAKTWTSAPADAGDWENYVWAKDDVTPNNSNGYAAGCNPGPTTIVGAPTVPGPTTVACAYSANGDCWVPGDFTASAAASTGGTGGTTYQICRSNDTTTTGGCDVNLTLAGGTSIVVSSPHLASDGYKRAYYFQAKDSAGAPSGWNVPAYVRIDRYAPAVSASNASDTIWYSYRTAVVSAADATVSAAANSGVAAVRYSWGTPLDAGCTSGTATAAGATLVAPNGDNLLYLCARDNTSRVSQWSGRYRVSPIALSGSITPQSTSYAGTFTYTASATGGTPSTYRYAFFRRRPGGTWIPDVNAPTWYTSNVFTWTPTQADVGTWETYIWVKDADTPASASGGYGYAAGVNTMPVEVVGPPTVPGPTTATCAYSAAGDCWVTGDFTISAAASTGGTGGITYQICRSNDTTTTGACAVDLATAGGTSILVSGTHLPSDSYRRAYYFQAKDNKGGSSGFNTPLYARVDRYAPTVSASNASSSWFPSRTAVVSAADATSGAGTNSGLAAVRYAWNSALDAGCTIGTATANGASLEAPSGDNVLYLCARDNTSRVAQWNGTYRVSAPLTISSCSASPARASYLGTFTISASASGGVPASTRFAFFRRHPGAPTWIPDVSAPSWQTSNSYAWHPAQADAGTWETYVWAKDDVTPNNQYGYAAGCNPGPIEVVGPPTMPGPTTLGCDFAAPNGDCWVAGESDVAASVTAPSTGGMGTLVYEVCRSNDSVPGGLGRCEVNLGMASGTSFLIPITQLPEDGFRRAFYFRAKDSAGATSAWNMPAYLRADRNGPEVSATNSSEEWFPSRTATVTATDEWGGPDFNSGLGILRYAWNLDIADGCEGGTDVAPGATIEAPPGDNWLNLCARDNVGWTVIWSGHYRVSGEITLTGTVSPQRASYLGSFQYTATATGGDAATRRFAFFRRRPGDVWIPDVHAPNWQASNQFTWHPTVDDVGTWETYIWVKDGNTPPTAGNGYGYAAGFNTMPIEVVGKPTAPGPTTVSCAYATGDDCWVQGDFTAGVTASTGGMDPLVYQICRSNDSPGGFAGCDVSLTLTGGTSIAVAGNDLAADGFRRAYYFQAKDSAGALSGWNTPRYVRVDRHAPAVSATNASDQWFNEARTATLSASDDVGGAAANSGLVELRYSWDAALDAACTTGTPVAPGATLTAPAGDNMLHLCARDRTGRVGFWDGRYRVVASPLAITSCPQSPATAPYDSPITWTVGVEGGAEGTRQFALFYRRPGGTWIPDVTQPAWQASNVLTWTPGSADVGTWETYVWVKDATTPPDAHGYGYAVGCNPGPVEVVVPENPDFQLEITPAAITLVRGASAQYSVTLTPGSGFSGTVSLSVPDAVIGTTYTLNPTTIGAGGTATLTVTTTNATAPDTYDITVEGVAGSLTRSATATLTVRQPAAGEPVIDSISPDSFDGGAVTTLTLRGRNFQNAVITLATDDPDPAHPTAKVFPTVGSVVVSSDGTRIDVQVDCRDPRIMDAYSLVVNNGVGKAASPAFRVIAAGPVVDLVTPGQPESGAGVYVLVLAGHHLNGTTVSTDPAGALEIFGIETAEDHINGLLRVPASTPPGMVAIVVRDAAGREARININVVGASIATEEITQVLTTKRIDPTTGKAMDGPSPSVLFQRFAVRDPETTEITSNGMIINTTTAAKLAAKSGGLRSKWLFLYFRYTLNLFNFSYTRAFTFDPITGEIGDAILKNLGFGDKVRFGALILAYRLRVDLTVDIYGTETGFTFPLFCLQITAGLQIPGLDGIFEHWNYCYGGWWIRFRNGRTDTLSAHGGECATVTPEGPPNNSELFAQAEQKGCCEQPIEVTGSGTAFSGSIFAQSFQVTTPNAGSTTPGQPCTCTIMRAPACVAKNQDQTFTMVGNPTGGAYQWRVINGGTHVNITRGATTDTATVRGVDASTAVDDVELEATYTQGGSVCTQRMKLTAIEIELPLTAFQPLRFHDTGQADANDLAATRYPSFGMPQLGLVNPGFPPGTLGFSDNMEIEAKIKPCDPALQCQFDFKRLRQGTIGQLINGQFQLLPMPVQLDCPGGGCDDDPHNNDEDLVLGSASDCSVYVIDVPGIGAPTTCSTAPTDPTDLINCLNFDEWLTVNGVRATPDLEWHAATRLHCTNGAWVRAARGAGNGIGESQIDCGRQAATAPASTAPQPVISTMDAVARLDDERMTTRSAAYQALLDKIVRGELEGEARRDVVAALLDQAQSQAADQLGSPPLLAIQLLGELRAAEAVPVLIERLVDEFPRPIAGSADQATPAAQALARIGEAAMKPLLDLAATGTTEQWNEARMSLEMTTVGPAQLRDVVAARLGAKPAELEQERLRELLTEIERKLQR